jgi:hypothetical protein
LTSSIAVVPIAGADPLREASLARELARRFLVWDSFVAGTRRVDVHPLVLPAPLHAQAVATAEGVVREVCRVADRAHADPVERALYRLDLDTLHLARASRSAGDDAALMRVDLLLDRSGHWQACEINADCPGGHNEAIGLPWLARAAGFGEGTNPTRTVPELVAKLRDLARGGPVALVHATAYAEDLQVCALVARELKRRGTRAILASPVALEARGDDLYVGRERVHALYRYFPIEWMTGQRNLSTIARAVASGRVRTLSSFAHVFAQSKLAFARAWEDAASHDAIEGRAVLSLIPETHAVLDIPRDELVRDRGAWVVKRALGRVGDDVFVGPLARHEQWAPLVDHVRARAAAGDCWIAQRFVDQRPVPTPWGDRLVTLGAYVLDGRFVGYFARITAVSHVSHDALCVPVFAAV